MREAEFDQFADEYYKQHRDNIAITGEAPEYFAEYKIKILNGIALRSGIAINSILDFGSGIGNSIPHFRHHLPEARLVSADVSQRSLDLAEKRFADKSESLLISGQVIPVENDAFDVAFSACVFHHIPHEEHVHWLSELHRVVRPGGLLVIFEHNPLNPLTVRAVNTCPFDANARLIRAGAFKESYRLAGWRQLSVKYHLFFPRMLAAMRPFEQQLVRLPLGAQYSLTGIKDS